MSAASLRRHVRAGSSILACCLSLGWAVGPALASPAQGSSYPAAVGASFRDAPYSPEIVVIPAGRGVVGSTEAETTREARPAAFAAYERPRHEVTMSRALGVGKYPVTLAEYQAFVTSTKRQVETGCNVMEAGKWLLDKAKSFRDTAYDQTPRHPVVCVDWQDAQDYAGWLSKSTGHQYRLLHEAEFEYASRAGTRTARWWSDDATAMCAHANGAEQSFDKVNPGDPKINRTCDDHFVFASPVGSFPLNPFGLSDMIGNVWEWTGDCFVDNYKNAATDIAAPVDGGDCKVRVIRGGSWHNYTNVLRAANRFDLPVGMHSSSLGFRVARLAD